MAEVLQGRSPQNVHDPHIGVSKIRGTFQGVYRGYMAGI